MSFQMGCSHEVHCDQGKKHSRQDVSSTSDQDSSPKKDMKKHKKFKSEKHFSHSHIREKKRKRSYVGSRSPSEVRHTEYEDKKLDKAKMKTKDKHKKVEPKMKRSKGKKFKHHHPPLPLQKKTVNKILRR